MTIEEIIKQCDKQISLLGEVASISLVMPGKWGKTNKRRLCKGGPVGDIVSDNFQGPGIIVLFGAIEVKQFLSDLVSAGYSPIHSWIGRETEGAIELERLKQQW